MKRVIACFAFLVLISCGSATKTVAVKPLYEVLTEQSDGGGNICFFEILSEASEIKMLESDENLRKKIAPGDINTSNFIILNMGEKKSGGYLIKVKNVEETADKIIVTVTEQEPKGEMASSEVSYPYTIVKINSKKNIVIK